MNPPKPPPWTRRDFLGAVAAASAAATLPGVLHAEDARPARRPNVLFIMADDMRVELGCYGSRFGAQTPNLDALAKSGVRFDRNYCQFPLCNPSRASLLTGRNPTTTGVLGTRTDFRAAHPDWTSLPQLFKANGYVSIRAGKIFHGNNLDDPKAWLHADEAPDPREAGGGKTKPMAKAPAAGKPADALEPLPLDLTQAEYSDRIVVLDGNGEGHGDYRTADRTIEHLGQYRDQPFFIACGFVKPHSPPCAPQKFLDGYDVDKIKLPPDFADIVSELGPKPGDFVIIKRQWGAFYGTELDLQLRRRGITTIILCGISTNIGVESTARFAYEYGYQQIFAEDAMSAMTEEEHNFTVTKTFPRLGLVRKTADILQSL